MPSRPFIAAIVLFWLAANGWLLYREAWPLWFSNEPPVYTIDLTEEVGTGKLGATTVDWVVLQKGTPIGHGFSRVVRLPDRTFELRSQFNFQKLRILIVDIKKITSANHVTEDGDLLGLSARCIMQIGSEQHDLEMEGIVDGEELVPRLFYNQTDVTPGEIRVPVSARGSAINPMHPLSRLPGLRVGQRWRIPLMDPTRADLGKILGPQFEGLLGSVKDLSVPMVDAEVTTDILFWDEAEVPCFKIEYRKPGEADVIASTWVRRRDGLVLQQHSRNDFLELTYRRVPQR